MFNSIINLLSLFGVAKYRIVIDDVLNEADWKKNSRLRLNFVCVEVTIEIRKR